MKLSTIALIIGVAVVGIIYYVKYHRPKKEMEDYNPLAPSAGEQTSPTSSYTPPVTPTEDKVNYTKTMKRDDKGKTVEYIQQALNRVLKLEGKTTLKVDGDFGSKTETEMINILGKKTGSYNEVKAAVIKKFIAAGKPNPYTGTTTTESSQNSSINYDTILSYITLQGIGGIDLNPLTPY